VKEEKWTQLNKAAFDCLALMVHLKTNAPSVNDSPPAVRDHGPGRRRGPHYEQGLTLALNSLLTFQQKPLAYSGNPSPDRNTRSVPRCTIARSKQPSTPSNYCSAHKRLISLHFGSRPNCVIGCIGLVYGDRVDRSKFK